MKSFFSLFLFSFILVLSSYAQSDTTVTIGTVPVNHGDTILVPVTVTNFNNIGAFGILISFDHSQLTFKNLVNVNPLFADALILNDDGTNLLMAWTTVPEKNFGDAKLFDINFKSNPASSGTSNVCFDPTSSVTNYFTLDDMTIVWTCGAVDIINGIKEYDTQAVYNVFPNPSNGHFVINLNKNDKEISIYSLNGNLVYNSKLENTAVKNSYSIDVAGLSKGMYLLKISGNNSTNYKKLVIN